MYIFSSLCFVSPLFCQWQPLKDVWKITNTVITVGGLDEAEPDEDRDQPPRPDTPPTPEVDLQPPPRKKLKTTMDSRRINVGIVFQSEGLFF